MFAQKPTGRVMLDEKAIKIFKQHKAIPNQRAIFKKQAGKLNIKNDNTKRP